MKKLTIIVALVALFAASGFAKTNTITSNKFETAVKAYKDALKSDNPGVRNSALYQIAVLKAKHPEVNLNGLDRDIVNLTNKDSEGLIRVNAKLTHILINDSNLVNKVAVETADPTEFFSGLYSQIADANVSR